MKHGLLSILIFSLLGASVPDAEAANLLCNWLYAGRSDKPLGPTDEDKASKEASDKVLSNHEKTQAALKLAQEKVTLTKKIQALREGNGGYKTAVQQIEDRRFSLFQLFVGLGRIQEAANLYKNVFIDVEYAYWLNELALPMLKEEFAQDLPKTDLSEGARKGVLKFYEGESRSASAKLGINKAQYVRVLSYLNAIIKTHPEGGGDRKTAERILHSIGGKQIGDMLVNEALPDVMKEALPLLEQRPTVKDITKSYDEDPVAVMARLRRDYREEWWVRVKLWTMNYQIKDAIFSLASKTSNPYLIKVLEAITGISTDIYAIDRYSNEFSIILSAKEAPQRYDLLMELNGREAGDHLLVHFARLVKELDTFNDIVKYSAERSAANPDDPRMSKFHEKLVAARAQAAEMQALSTRMETPPVGRAVTLAVVSSPGVYWIIANWDKIQAVILP